MNPLISVIVPVYNVEQYLEQCVESILHQTYENLEIILVDDGSADRSGAICDSYQKNDKRIRVIHKKNGGLSSARNAALDIMNGKYVSFVDGDDYISEQMLEVLYGGIKKNNARAAVCNMILFQDGDRHGLQSYFNRADSFSADREKIIRKALSSSQSVCNKLFQASLFQCLRFPDGRIAEDGYISYDLLWRAGRVSYHILGGYYYRQKRKGSIISEKFKSQDIDILLCNLRTCIRVSRTFPALKEEALEFYYQKGFLQAIKKLSPLTLRELVHYRREIRVMQKAAKYIIWDVLRAEKMHGIEKIQIFLFVIFPFVSAVFSKSWLIQK